MRSALIALRAALSALEAKGVRLVPEQPTPEMVKAAIDADDKRTGGVTSAHLYRAMVSAFLNETKKAPDG